MKKGLYNSNDTKKKDIEATTSESKSADVSVNISSNPNITKTSTDLATSSKKDINYIFQLNVTKMKLESIQKKIEKLVNKAQEIGNLLQEKYSMIQFHQEQVYLADIDYHKQLSAFHKSVKFHNIPDIKIITDLVKRDDFLRRYETHYLNTVVMPFLASLPEKDSQKLAQAQQSLLDQEMQRMDQVLEQLNAMYLNVVIEKEQFDEKQKKFVLLKKEITDLQQKYSALQSDLQVEQQKYQDVHQHGLLKSYEVSDVKISINDFIAHPAIELQMKKLISIFNNQSEAKKFGLSLPKGILFVGEPETGKTFAAKVFASEVDRKMYHIKAHDVFSEDSTDPNQMLYIIFYSIIDHIQKTKESCIIFLDEIEKIINSMGEYALAEQKVISNTILKNIINIQKSNLDITIIAALGNKNRIDPRFMKYDIFDNQFFFELPGPEERKRLFQLYMQKAEKRAKLKLFDQNILDDLVKKTDGFSPELIKQLINSCVKEYLYSYLNAKKSFDIDTEYISEAITSFSVLHQNNPSKKNMLPREERQKIVSLFMMKHRIFGPLDTKGKGDAIKNHILDVTESYSETDMNTFLNMLLDTYQNRKAEYHRKSLIKKEFILGKISELRAEEKKKGNSSYLSNK